MTPGTSQSEFLQSELLDGFRMGRKFGLGLSLSVQIKGRPPVVPIHLECKSNLFGSRSGLFRRQEGSAGTNIRLDRRQRHQ